MHKLPKHLATMPNPCKGVPANPWCRAQQGQRTGHALLSIGVIAESGPRHRRRGPNLSRPMGCLVVKLGSSIVADEPRRGARRRARPGSATSSPSCTTPAAS